MSSAIGVVEAHRELDVTVHLLAMLISAYILFLIGRNPAFQPWRSRAGAWWRVLGVRLVLGLPPECHERCFPVRERYLSGLYAHSLLINLARYGLILGRFHGLFHNVASCNGSVFPPAGGDLRTDSCLVRGLSPCCDQHPAGA